MLFLSHLWMLCLFLNENIKKTKTQNSPNLNIVICCWCTYLNIAQYSFESIISANKHPICQEGGSNLGITRCKDCQTPSMGQDNVPEVLPVILQYCNDKCFDYMNPKLWTSSAFKWATHQRSQFNIFYFLQLNCWHCKGPPLCRKRCNTLAICHLARLVIPRVLGRGAALLIAHCLSPAPQSISDTNVIQGESY